MNNFSFSIASCVFGNGRPAFMVRAIKPRSAPRPAIARSSDPIKKVTAAEPEEPKTKFMPYVIGSAIGLLVIAALQAAFSDFRNERPGVIHRITVADLPKPYATESVRNNPTLVPRPPRVLVLVDGQARSVQRGANDTRNDTAATPRAIRSW